MSRVTSQGVILPKEYTLYSNDSGTTENITLSDSVANYKYIEIMYGCDGFYFSRKIFNPNGKAVGLLATYCDTSGSARMYTYCSNWNINGTNVTFVTANNKYLTENNTVDSYGQSSYVKIYKIIGYK